MYQTEPMFPTWTLESISTYYRGKIIFNKGTKIHDIDVMHAGNLDIL